MMESTSWCLSSHGEFLGIFISYFAIFQSTRRSPTREQYGVINALYLDTVDIDILVVVDKFYLSVIISGTCSRFFRVHVLMHIFLHG